MGNRTVARHAAGPRPDHADGVRTLFDAKAARWPAKYAPDGPLAGRLAQLTGAVGTGSAMAANCSTSAAAAVSSRGTWRAPATG